MAFNYDPKKIARAAQSRRTGKNQFRPDADTNFGGRKRGNRRSVPPGTNLGRSSGAGPTMGHNPPTGAKNAKGARRG